MRAPEQRIAPPTGAGWSPVVQDGAILAAEPEPRRPRAAEVSGAKGPVFRHSWRGGRSSSRSRNIQARGALFSSDQPMPSGRADPRIARRARSPRLTARHAGTPPLQDPCATQQATSTTLRRCRSGTTTTRYNDGVYEKGSRGGGVTERPRGEACLAVPLSRSDDSRSAPSGPLARPPEAPAPRSPVHPREPREGGAPGRLAGLRRPWAPPPDCLHLSCHVDCQ